MIPPADLLRLSQLRLIFLVALLRGIARRLPLVSVLDARPLYLVRPGAGIVPRCGGRGPPLLMLRRLLPAVVVVSALPVAVHALRRRVKLRSSLVILRRPLPVAVIIFAPTVAAVVIVAFMAIMIAPMPVIIIAVIIIRTPVRAVIVTRRPPGVVIAAIGVISVAAVV